MSGHSDVMGAQWYPEQFGVSLEEQNKHYYSLEEDQYELEEKEEQSISFESTLTIR